MAVENGTPSGCGSKGNCATGGCNRMNTFDWLTQMDITDVDEFNIVEISFKNGARKSFYRVETYQQVYTGDMAVVEVGGGYDIGRISLSGELVRLQMKKKRFKEDNVLHSVIRRANERDLERLAEARMAERDTLIRARAISRTLDLDMKIGDVEFQGDKRKATFYYTANGRVDFRELIRHFAKEFRVKIEMRQIGARQESARIGGIGSCGRELCCSTWLTDFKSVSTAAARYQNLAINQAKLSGQCGRLKCCLNYELDTYMEAVQAFPERAERISTEAGTATLIKTDIFKQLMFYAYTDSKNRGKLYALSVEQVREIQVLNRKGEKPLDLGILAIALQEDEDDEPGYGDDVTGFIELPPEERKKKKRSNRRKNTGDRSEQTEQPRAKSGNRERSRPPADNRDKPKPATGKPATGKTAPPAGEPGEQADRSKRRPPRKKAPRPENQADAPKPPVNTGGEEGDAANSGSNSGNRNRNRRRKNRRRGGGGSGGGANRPPAAE